MIVNHYSSPFIYPNAFLQDWKTVRPQMTWSICWDGNDLSDVIDWGNWGESSLVWQLGVWTKDLEHIQWAMVNTVKITICIYFRKLDSSNKRFIKFLAVCFESFSNSYFSNSYLRNNYYYYFGVILYICIKCVWISKYHQIEGNYHFLNRRLK